MGYIDEITKCCTVCGEEKPLSEFYKNKHMRDGHINQCRLCVQKRDKASWEKRKAQRVTQAAENSGYKVCTKCGRELPASLDYFAAAERYAKGLNSVCRECYRAWQRDYYKRNPERRRELSRNWSSNHSEDCRRRAKKWAVNNKEHIREYNVAYRDRAAELARLRYQRNKEECRCRNNEYQNHRRANNIKVRLNHAVEVSVWSSLKGNKDGYRWESLVGYTLEELMSHLETLFRDGMGWDNYGKDGWHIDHIRPTASFHFESYDDPQFKECWALSNLRPMWAYDNISKGAKWKGVDYKKYQRNSAPK